VVAAVLVLDADASSRGYLFSGNLMIANLLLLTSALLLWAWGTAKGRKRRRYTVAGKDVVLPVGANPRLPRWIPFSDIIGITIIPVDTPQGHLPAAVRIIVAVPAPDVTVAADRQTNLMFDIRADRDAFGLRNLQDFVKRVPEEKLDPYFGRAWRARLTSGHDS
jgi:hypothetical protein